MDTVRAFKLVSLAEATSFLLLIAASIVKRIPDGSDLGVKILGPIHGVLFIAYVGLVFLNREKLAWNPFRTVLALVASVLPVAPYFVERYWIKEAKVQPA
ncbi:DUF3817 domain-containing protein [Actinocorallia lasiicapitis]